MLVDEKMLNQMAKSVKVKMLLWMNRHTGILFIFSLWWGWVYLQTEQIVMEEKQTSTRQHMLHPFGVIQFFCSSHKGLSLVTWDSSKSSNTYCNWNSCLFKHEKKQGFQPSLNQYFIFHRFWAGGDPDPTEWSYATCCDHQRKWTQTYNSNKKWICEKNNYFLL